MRISRRFKRIVSAMLATALAFTMTFSTDVMPLADSKQDQLKAEVSAKQAELDKVNAALKEKNALMLVKIHPAQDLSLIDTTGYSRASWKNRRT